MRAAQAAIVKGIIDRAKVVRLGLESAVSVASPLLLAEATLAEIKEKLAASAAGAELG
jgi:chaperonin GroEL (HSP60 family)